MAGVYDKILSEKYVENVNPARFALIKRLCERADAPEHADNKKLVEKIRLSIESYKVELGQGKEKADVLMRNIECDFPDTQLRAKQLLEQYRFKELSCLYAGLNKQTSSSESSLSALTQLNSEMQVSSKSEPQVDLTQTLDQMLFTQEQQTRNQTGAPELINTDTNSNELELQSLKALRKSMKYSNVDATIARAIDHFPENAGPHNPHMLAITSLMKMRDLSPQYLRRFTSYIETVLWLEKNEVKLNNKKGA